MAGSEVANTGFLIVVSAAAPIQEAVGTVVQIITAIVAVIALVRTSRAEARSQSRLQEQERRNQQRFDEQLNESRRIAAANVRPLLTLEVEAHGDRKALILCNHGPGPAVITQLSWRRTPEFEDARDSQDLGDLVRMDGLPFDELSSFDSPHYVPGKSSEVVIKLTKEALVQRGGMPAEQADMKLRQLETIIDEIALLVTYEDVLGTIIGEGVELK